MARVSQRRCSWTSGCCWMRCLPALHLPESLMHFHALFRPQMLLQHADAEAKQSKGAAQNSLLSAVALCDHAGEVIYVGQTRGTIAIVDANSLRFLDVIKARPPEPFLTPQSSCILHRPSPQGCQTSLREPGRMPKSSLVVFRQ